MRRRRSRVIRYSGLDVVNGSERLRSDFDDVNALDYSGWRCGNTEHGYVAITNSLSASSSKAWLVIEYYGIIVGYYAVRIKVTSARLVNSVGPESQLSYRGTPGDGVLLANAGVMNVLVASTSAGVKRMVNFMQRAANLDYYHDGTELAAMYQASSTPPRNDIDLGYVPGGLDDAGYGYLVDVGSFIGGAIINRYYTDGVQSPYSSGRITVCVIEVLP